MLAASIISARRAKRSRWSWRRASPQRPKWRNSRYAVFVWMREGTPLSLRLRETEMTIPVSRSLRFALCSGVIRAISSEPARCQSQRWRRRHRDAAVDCRASWAGPAWVLQPWTQARRRVLGIDLYSDRRCNGRPAECCRRGQRRPLVLPAGAGAVAICFAAVALISRFGGVVETMDEIEARDAIA
jgi:hypothetical protein